MEKWTLTGKTKMIKKWNLTKSDESQIVFLRENQFSTSYKLILSLILKSKNPVFRNFSGPDGSEKPEAGGYAGRRTCSEQPEKPPQKHPLFFLKPLGNKQRITQQTPAVPLQTCGHLQLLL